MSALLVAVLAASLAAPPGAFPDGKTIDGFSFRFGSEHGSRVPTAYGTLTVSADGKVTYSHSTPGKEIPNPQFGCTFPQKTLWHFGTVTEKKWEIKKEEAEALFRKFVADGLLDLPTPPAPKGFSFYPPGAFEVKSGKWAAYVGTFPVPDKLMAHLRPLLAKAHPELWAEKPVEKPVAEPVGKLGEVSSVTYSYSTTDKLPEHPTLTIFRDGRVKYRRFTYAPDWTERELTSKTWEMPAKDAAALLDALAADGVLDLKRESGDTKPWHYITVTSGRWSTGASATELPEKLSKHLQPLLKKADAEFWK